MATVDKEIADDIIAGKYEDDEPMSIVEYDNACGGKGYGVVFKGEDPNTYLMETEYIRNPVLYWKRGEK